LKTHPGSNRGPKDCESLSINKTFNPPVFINLPIFIYTAFFSVKPIKQKILNNALTLFNENGFVNVRLQHIADGTGISVGNLAYHFKTKDDIILSLYNALDTKQELLLKELRVLPLFEDIDTLLRNLFQLQQQYLFFYLDTLEVLRAFPEIAMKHRQLLLLQRQQVEFMMEFNVARGAFVRPPHDEQFEHLAYLFCMAMDNWMSFQYINGNNKPDEAAYCNDVWSILRILFTEVAMPEFRQLTNKRIDYF
jgi:AcrR family transcriptional regulator